MSALRHPLDLRQGDTFSLPFIRALDKLGQVPVDITGRKYYVQFRRFPDSDEVVYSASSEGTSPHIVVATPTNGTGVWTIPDEVLWGIQAPFKGDYDFIEDIGGVRKALFEGPVNIAPGVTRGV